jgi:HAD superfamily hydrolase (TIGR01484 family)
MPYQLILATDLDGTFLEGDAPTKLTFYQKLWQLREQIMLIYTTGRPVETVKQFCLRGYLPLAHFVLGDHGTHVVDGSTFQPLEALQNPIAKTWNQANSLLIELLRNENGLQRQPLDPPYRLAYYYDSHLQNHTLEKIIQAGFDLIQSNDMYLDILPRGVNKGTSLLKLIQHCNLNQDSVVTAGDSLNDLCLFQTGLRSIAVANSEPKLLNAIKQLTNVYQSPFAGVSGIIDGLKFYQHFHLFDQAEQDGF